MATIINLLLFKQIKSFLRVYLIFLSQKYLLTDFILFDNYKVIYIVNTKDLLLSDSIIFTNSILLNVKIR